MGAIVKVLMYFSGMGVKLKIYFGLAIAFAGIIGMAVLKGQSMQKTKEVLKDAKEYKKTSKIMANAPTDDHIKRLRDRLTKRGL